MNNVVQNHLHLCLCDYDGKRGEQGKADGIVNREQHQQNRLRFKAL